jgi:multiple sugar transport system permease protein
MEDRMGSFVGEFQKARSSKGKGKRQRMSPMERYQAKWGFIFISPWVIGFLVFLVVPMIASFIFSLWDFQLATPEESRFIGLTNWQRMLGFSFAEGSIVPNDPLVWTSLGITFKFAFITLPIGFGVAIFLAILLNSEELLGRNIFRTLFYAPTMIPGIASILIIRGVSNTQTGWVNRLIEWVSGCSAEAITCINAVGINGIRWFDEPSLIYYAYTFIGLWGIGNTILITLAGLQNVPTELYDASKVDGAGWWRRLWFITLPMISPVIFYNLVLGVIGLLQYFNTPYVLNGGNGYPQGSTRFYMIYFYKQAFNFAEMGYGASLAWFMFLIALLITIVLFGTARYWVYYAGGDQK